MGSLADQGWPVMEPLIKLNEVATHGGWNESILHQLEGANLFASVQSHHLLLKAKPNVRIWCPSNSDFFSTSSSSVWDLLRCKYSTLQPFKMIWN